MTTESGLPPYSHLSLRAAVLAIVAASILAGCAGAGSGPTFTLDGAVDNLRLGLVRAVDSDEAGRVTAVAARLTNASGVAFLPFDVSLSASVDGGWERLERRIPVEGHYGTEGPSPASVIQPGDTVTVYARVPDGAAEAYRFEVDVSPVLHYEVYDRQAMEAESPGLYDWIVRASEGRDYSIAHSGDVVVVRSRPFGIDGGRVRAAAAR